MREATLQVWSVIPRTFGALACLLAALSCGSSETFVAPAPSRCALQATVSTSAFSAGGGSATVRVTSDRECAWSVQSDAAWIALSPQASGTGEGSVQFTVAANNDPSSRTGGLTVSDQRLPISQEGRPCVFRLSSTQESVDVAGGRRTIEVDSSSSGCSWSATADVPWVRLVEGNTGSGDGMVVFDVGPASAPRVGTVTIAGQQVQIAQGLACTYATGTTVLSVAATGGSTAVTVSAPPGCTWRAESQVPWISIASGVDGNGPGVVNLSVSPVSGAPRTGTVLVAGVIVTITQGSTCDIDVQPLTHAAPVGGGTASVTVRTAPHCPWVADSGASWIQVTSDPSGTGDGQVRFAVAQNGGPARSGSLSVGGRIVSVSQPSGCAFSVTPSSVDVPHASSTVPVSIATTAGCPWSVGTDSAWFSVSQTSGAGSAQLTLTAAANAGPPRAGSLGVAGRTITVSQASACTWRIAPPSPHDFGANGGLGSLLVIVGGQCSWTAASTVSWITLEAGFSGTGDGLVQVTVAPNAGAARSGIVEIAGMDYVIRQSGR